MASLKGSFSPGKYQRSRKKSSLKLNEVGGRLNTVVNRLNHAITNARVGDKNGLIAQAIMAYRDLHKILDDLGVD